MYDHKLHTKIVNVLDKHSLDRTGKDDSLYTRFIANASPIHSLYNELYGHHKNGNHFFNELPETIRTAHINRSLLL